MNIYIFGSKKFSQNIHRTLDHGNIKFKIEDGVVREVTNPKELQELIMEDPTQVFLIDDNKIIYDDYFSKKLKFLQPKDGISNKFLEEYGMGDVSEKKEDDIVKYIEKRIESLEKMKPKVKADEITTIDQMFEQYD